MPTRSRAAYLDSSAIVKLVVEERETAALRTFLRDYPHRISSILAQVEVARAARLHGPSTARQAHLILRALDTVGITDQVANVAGRLEPAALRSLDAIHLATALLLGSALTVLVTYDDRMAHAARQAGLPVMGPT